MKRKVAERVALLAYLVLVIQVNSVVSADEQTASLVSNRISEGSRRILQTWWWSSGRNSSWNYGRQGTTYTGGSNPTGNTVNTVESAPIDNTNEEEGTNEVLPPSSIELEVVPEKDPILVIFPGNNKDIPTPTTEPVLPVNLTDPVEITIDIPDDGDDLPLDNQTELNSSNPYVTLPQTIMNETDAVEESGQSKEEPDSLPGNNQTLPQSALDEDETDSVEESRQSEEEPNSLPGNNQTLPQTTPNDSQIESNNSNPYISLPQTTLNETDITQEDQDNQEEPSDVQTEVTFPSPEKGSFPSLPDSNLSEINGTDALLIDLGKNNTDANITAPGVPSDTTNETAMPQIGISIKPVLEEGESFNMTSLVDAINKGMFSEAIKLVPVDGNGTEFTAVLGPEIQNKFVLNMSELIAALGSDATLGIECKGEGCQIVPIANAAEVKSSQGRRLLVDRRDEIPELFEVILGCGPQTLVTNVSDGESLYELSISLEGPSIQNCTDLSTELEGGTDGQNQTISYRNVEPEQSSDADLVEKKDESNNVLKIALPICIVVGAIIISACVFAFISIRKKKQAGDIGYHRQASASPSPSPPPDRNVQDFASPQPYSTPFPARVGERGQVGTNQEVLLDVGQPMESQAYSGKLAANEDMLSSFRNPIAESNTVTSKLASNEDMLASFRNPISESGAMASKLASNQEMLDSFGTPTAEAIDQGAKHSQGDAAIEEDVSRYIISNPNRNEVTLAVLSETSSKTVEMEQRVQGIVEQMSSAQKRRNIAKGKKVKKDKNPTLVETFQSSSSSSNQNLMKSPKVLESFKILQKLIDDDDVEN